MKQMKIEEKIALLTDICELNQLIEKYELSNINVISANTDGVTIMLKRTDVDKMNEINKWWMDLTTYELEDTHYAKIIFSTVNDYLAIKTDGEIKKKGDFLTDFELHKNKSARIVPIALEHFFVNDVPVDTTIRNHTNIYDFALRQKASRNFHYEGIQAGKVTTYNKLIRYYVSNTGEKLMKIKNPECDTNAAEASQVEAGEWVMTVCNKLTKDHPLDNINYDYYIEKANRIIEKIQFAGRRRKIIVNPNQMSLF